MSEILCHVNQDAFRCDVIMHKIKYHANTPNDFIISYYSGPEGARVKVSPLFFVIIICVFRAPNFLRGYKAQTRIELGY